MFSRILSFYREKKARFNVYRYRKSIPRKVEKIRGKETIKVLFVVSEVSIWKTEPLYCEMLKHPRFEPLLGVSLLAADKPSEAVRKFELLTKYLSDKNYSYIELFGCDINENIKPDIIFYQQPYEGVINDSLSYISNKDALFCYVNYGFNSIGQKWLGGISYLHHCWRIFFENSVSKNYYESVLPSLARNNGSVTGLPIQDTLQRNKMEFLDPWKSQNKAKKRIIWAPHHSIPLKSNVFYYSTFLDVADIMLELAQEFKDEIQMAFKPHPFLLKKLYDIWGKNRADNYYLSWSQLENTQFETGEYYGLFKHSDALIHDCGSFTIEYLYMDKPVMYLTNGNDHLETLNDFGKSAYNAHVFGKSKEDIVKFIQDVINGIDLLKNERKQFLDDFLAIPDLENASQNIINSILKDS